MPNALDPFRPAPPTTTQNEIFRVANAKLIHLLFIEAPTAVAESGVGVDESNRFRSLTAFITASLTRIDMEAREELSRHGHRIDPSF